MFAIILVIGTLCFHIAYVFMQNKPFCGFNTFPDSLLYLPHSEDIKEIGGVSYDFQIPSIIRLPTKPAETGGEGEG